MVINYSFKFNKTYLKIVYNKCIKMYVCNILILYKNNEDNNTVI